MCERACACASEWGKSECVGVWSRRRHAYAHTHARARTHAHTYPPPHTGGQARRRLSAYPSICPCTPARPYPPLCLSRQRVSSACAGRVRACTGRTHARTLLHARTVRVCVRPTRGVGRTSTASRSRAGLPRPKVARRSPPLPPSAGRAGERWWGWGAAQAHTDDCSAWMRRCGVAAPSVRRATKRSVRDSARRSQIKRGVVKQSRLGRFGVPEQARDGLRSGDGDL